MRCDAACADGLLESDSLVSEPKTTCDEEALPEAGASFPAAVPASVMLARTWLCEEAAAPILSGVIGSEPPEAWLEACDVGARELVSLLSDVDTAPIDAGVMASEPPVACDAACEAGEPPPRAAMAPHVTRDVSVPSAVSTGTRSPLVADAAGRPEICVSGISIAP